MDREEEPESDKGKTVEWIVRLKKGWSRRKMRDKLQEQAMDISDKYDELWDEKPDEGQQEDGMSECDVWGPREEQVIREERMWQLLGWRNGILRTIQWLRDNEGIEWEEWSESIKDGVHESREERQSSAMQFALCV